MKEILKLIYDVCDKEDREKISEFVKNKDKEWLIEYFIRRAEYLVVLLRGWIALNNTLAIR